VGRGRQGKCKGKGGKGTETERDRMGRHGREIAVTVTSKSRRTWVVPPQNVEILKYGQMWGFSPQRRQDKPIAATFRMKEYTVGSFFRAKLGEYRNFKIWFKIAVFRRFWPCRGVTTCIYL